MTTEKKLRAFIALDLPEELLVFLKNLQERLCAGTRGRVKPGNIHLTLRFLGDITESEAQKAAGALERAVSGIEAMSLAAGKVELKNNRVLWVAVEDDARLTGFKTRLDAELAAAGFADGEKRAFKAHLTLARVRDADDARGIRQLLRGHEDTRTVFSPLAATLYRSELSAGGARYTVLKTFRLSACQTRGGSI